jgi:HAD superfamily hydrolase (TIGR01509 family)
MSHEVGVRKPDAGFFRACENQAGCAPDECLFVDDMPINVEGARALGWQGIVYRDFAALHSSLSALGVFD